ncbi:MAG: hypothetical protein EBT55_02790, partial [Proteobacteria bacterium]|nr:hypothetical protein [Pseudomonadota bacterium]
MPYFTTQINNIQSIFQTWKNLSEPNKSMRINHILPFLQLASIINTVSPDDKLKEILNNFKQYYESDKNQHPLELKTGSSQLSYEKLKKISDGKIGETIPTDRVNEVLKYKNAYHHAHVVVNYYFGNLIDERSFSTDFGDFIKEINDIVQKKLQQQKGTVFDKTENQVLLNQAGDFARQLQESAEIVNDPELVLQWQEQFNSAYPTSYTQNTSEQIGVFQQKSMPSAGSIEEPITIRAGVEVEISFANQNSRSRQAEFDYKTIADLNKILATFNNTEAFEKNYAGSNSSLETVNRVNCSKLVKMIEEESLAKNSDQIEHINLNRGTFNLIKKIILQNTKRDNVDLKETEVEKTISKMSKEEALAFLLLFGNEELSHTQSLPINFDGIKPNATAVYELITEPLQMQQQRCIR